MDCPKCQTPLTQGRVRLAGTLLGAFLFGLSREHLWFEEEKPEAKAQVVMESATSRDAARCPRCGTLVIPFEEDERR